MQRISLIGLALAAACLLGGPSIAGAGTVVGVSIGVAPGLRYSGIAVATPPAWIPGYWRWNGTRTVFVNGYVARPGYRYWPARYSRLAWRRAGYWRR